MSNIDRLDLHLPHEENEDYKGRFALAFAAGSSRYRNFNDVAEDVFKSTFVDCSSFDIDYDPRPSPQDRGVQYVTYVT